MSNLDKFPRPANDTGVGVHWSNSPTKWGKENWSFWKDFLIKSEIKWVKVLSNGELDQIDLIYRLVDLGIMPVIRIYQQKQNPDYTISRYTKYIKLCCEVGAKYFEFNNEPDSQREWSKSKPENWLNLVVINFIQDCAESIPLGAIPLFPAFSFGGPIKNPFELIKQYGGSNLLDKIGLAIHNYGLGRPVNYPNDVVSLYGAPLTLEEYMAEDRPLWAWEISGNVEYNIAYINEQRKRTAEMNRRTIYEKLGGDESKLILFDNTCFRAYEKFNNQVVNAVGFSIPIFMTEGGYNVGERAPGDARYPRPSPNRMSRLTKEMFEYDTPDYYFASMPWLISTFNSGAVDYEAQGPWFTTWYDNSFGLNGKLPIVDMLPAKAGIKKDGPLPTEWPYYKGPDLSDRDFSDELKYLTPVVELEPYLGDSKWYYKLINVKYDNKGTGNVFVKVLNENSEPNYGHSIFSKDSNQLVKSVTKGKEDNYFGNLPIRNPTSVYVDGHSDVLKNVYSGTLHLVFKKTRKEPKMAFNFFEYRELAKNTKDLVTSNFPSKNLNGQEKFPKVDSNPASTGNSDKYYKVKLIRHLNGYENQFGNFIFVDVLDENGVRVSNNYELNWGWEGMTSKETPSKVRLDKPANEPAGHIAIANCAMDIWIEVNNQPSEIVYFLNSRFPDEDLFNRMCHHSWYVVFQLVTRSTTTPSEPLPTPEGTYITKEDLKRLTEQINDTIHKFFEDKL